MSGRKNAEQESQATSNPRMRKRGEILCSVLNGDPNDQIIEYECGSSLYTVADSVLKKQNHCMEEK